MIATNLGRVYIDYHWEVSADHDGYYRPSFPEDYVLVETPHIVPNGKWVMEHRGPGWSWLVGIDHTELEQVTVRSKEGHNTSIYFSDKPFGYIVIDADDMDKSVYPPQVKPGASKTLVYARQIHKGELGRGVQIPTLDYVRQQDPSYKTEGGNARARRHGQRGWVKLADLGEALSISTLEASKMVLGYWQFSGHRNYRHYDNLQDGGQLVDLISAKAPQEVTHGTPIVNSLTMSDFSGIVDGRFTDSLDELWIHRGFAYTILRLQTLGVQPEVVQPA